jgi:hypothetical protein
MSHGVELAIRSVALPFVLGRRWLADHGGEAVADADTLTHGWMRRLKTAADELFVASELLVEALATTGVLPARGDTL